MQKREIALAIIFTIITCGIYGIYWFICLTDDINYASGRQDTSGGMAFLFTIITCGIYQLYWSYKMGENLNDAKIARGIPVDPNAGIIYLILSFLGLGIIAFALMQNEINKMAQ